MDVTGDWVLVLTCLDVFEIVTPLILLYVRISTTSRSVISCLARQ